MDHGPTEVTPGAPGGGFQERLVFRRQFLLGPREFLPTAHFSALALRHGLTLSAHADLEVVERSTDRTSLILVGTCLDPLRPEASTREILGSLLDRSSDLNGLLALSAPLAGRWVLVYQDQAETYLFTDPCGFRQVYYRMDGCGPWCGSQPEIIRHAVGLERKEDEELATFLLDRRFARQESAFVGDGSVYEACRHLLPNHYLGLNSGEPSRFFPAARTAAKPESEIVDLTLRLLRGSIDGAIRRSDLRLAVTAGWDSRVLLAASREWADSIEYYVDRQGSIPHTHPDVWVPRRLAEKVDIDFTVRDSPDDLPGWLVSLLVHNVTDARVLPKTRTIYSSLREGETRTRVNGNGSEICRNYFDKHCRLAHDDLSVSDLVALMGYRGLDFVERELAAWTADLGDAGANGYSVLDMLYWEQRLGNWGAQFPAEQDIAVEEFSPFNCRLLIATLLSAPRSRRAAPDYPVYRRIIEEAWPELLTVPFNPPPRVSVRQRGSKLLRRTLRPFVPSAVVKWLGRKG